MYLSEVMISEIASLRDKPIDEPMRSHLMALFGKDGLVDEIAAIQESRWSTCPDAGTKNCDCGACEPYRQGPLLDEVLQEIHAFERGNLIFDETGLVTRPPEEDLPF